MKKIGLLLILSALALALIVTLAGCGTKKTATTQSSTTPASTTSTTTPAANTPATPQPPAQEPIASETPAAQPETTATVTQPTTPAEATPSPQEQATPEAPAVQPEVATPNASDEDTDPSATFSKSIQALQSLSSYRYTTTMKYEGTGDNSTDDSGTLEVHGEFSAPDSYRIIVNDSANDKKSEFIKIGDSLWMNDGEKWTKVPDLAAPAISKSIFNFGLAFVWGSLAEGMETGANFVGKERVNGIKALHYSSTNSDWEKKFDAKFQNAHGDVWVAEAGYPVKFVFAASGTNEDGTSGSVEWRSDVTDVNKEVKISAPIIAE